MKAYELLLRYGIAETARQTGINENTLKGFVDKLLNDESSMEAEIDRRANEKVEEWKNRLFDMLIDMVEDGETEGVPAKVEDLMKFIGSQIKPKESFKKKTSHKND